MGETVANAVIYARYSSHGQQETSIEGQLKVCYDFCKRQGYAVIGEYIDRALTGKTDNRPEFQRMVADAPKGAFQYIIVYQLDRFSRNRYDSAIYKNKLKKHGVRVLSAKENIADDPSGILMESVLEGMAEYFSAELAIKVKRGMTVQAEKCLFTGGTLPIGYYVDTDKSIKLNPEEAPIVRGIFEQYANGAQIKDICAQLNAMGFKNKIGNKFKPTTLANMLHNDKYLGIYRFGDIEIPDGIPRIVSDELFYEVQRKLDNKKHAPASNRNVQYLLSGKLFCGECNNAMIGYCGTSRTKIRYYYYVCTGRRAHKCDMDNIKKDDIETVVLEYCRSLLDDSVLERLIKELMKLSEEDYSKSEIAVLEKQLAEVERKIQNTTDAIVDCDFADVRKSMYAALNELHIAKEDLDFKIAQFTRLQHKVNESDVRKFLLKLREGSYDTIQSQQVLINTLINRVYVYKDKLVLIFNSGHKKELITEELLDEINEKDKSSGSSLNQFGVLTVSKTNLFCVSECFVLVIRKDLRD